MYKLDLKPSQYNGENQHTYLELQQAQLEGREDMKKYIAEYLYKLDAIDESVYEEIKAIDCVGTDD